MTRRDAGRLARALIDELHHTAPPMLAKQIGLVAAGDDLVGWPAWVAMRDDPEWWNLVWRALECAGEAEETTFLAPCKPT